jgi:L-ascorbate metabolism protein UlaG (beta-lactamase superfamily)
MDIRFLGQSCFELSSDSAKVIVDPFLTGNPKGAIAADEVECDAILLTHGHADHFGDTVDIAKRTGATVVAIVEIANELMNEHGLENVKDPNLGGTVEFDWGWVRLVPAWHTNTTPSGTVAIPAGLVIKIGDAIVYHLGDTCLFSDLALPGKRDDIDVAILPIGGHYTMDRHDAVTAAELVGAQTVIPCHYDTFPPIETDAEAFKSDVENSTASSVVILQPGESHTV